MADTGALESQLSAINRWDPKVEALVDWDESAARERARETGCGPLAGWSVAVKDIIDLAGMPTRCNADFVPVQSAPKNAAIVDALLTRGAFVMSKSVTTTFAYSDPGPTRNPWNLDHTPGGSSSGSAAAVACGMARLALGSQTVGSVNRPASFCGVVGFKPTFAWFSVDGIFPFAPSVDTVGFFTSNVHDVQTTYSAVSGEPSQEAQMPLRIAYVPDQLCESAEPAMLEAIEAASRRLSAAGHDVSERSLPGLLTAAHDNHWELVAAEVAQSHRDLFSKYGASYTPKLRDLIERGHRVEKSRVEEIQTHRRQCIDRIDELFDTYDLLLTASAPGPAPHGLDSTGEPRMNLLWTYVGFPTLTLPMSLDASGLPLGMQLVGRRKKDQALLASGTVIEPLLAFTDKPSLRQERGTRSK